MNSISANPHTRLDLPTMDTVQVCGVTLLILLGGSLVSAQFRAQLPYGEVLPAEYQAYPPLLFLLIGFTGVVVPAALIALSKRTPNIRPRLPFLSAFLSIVFIFLESVVFLPDFSLLQLLYFVGFSSFLVICLILLPQRLMRRNPVSMAENLRRLGKSDTLLRLWVANNIKARYSQAVLGILWIILLPLSYSLVLSFVFANVVRMDVGDVPFISFLMAALVPWNLFQQSIINSTGAITSYMALINQIYFPREILILVKLGEGFVDFTFTFIALMIVNVFVGILPNIYYLYLPLLIAITLCLTFGLMLFASYLTVFVRDVPQLIFVAFQLLFYLTPILYPAHLLPAEFRFIAVFNPMVPIVLGVRDIIVYGQAPNLSTLFYPLVMALVVLTLGYTYFKANESRLADFL